MFPNCLLHSSVFFKSDYPKEYNFFNHKYHLFSATLYHRQNQKKEKKEKIVFLANRSDKLESFRGKFDSAFSLDCVPRALFRDASGLQSSIKQTKVTGLRHIVPGYYAVVRFRNFVLSLSHLSFSLSFSLKLGSLLSLSRDSLNDSLSTGGTFSPDGSRRDERRGTCRDDTS